MVFTKYRPIFRGIGEFEPIEDADRRIIDSTYSNDNNPDGKIKRVNFFIEAGEDGRFKLEYAGFNSGVTAFDKNDRNNKKTLKYGEEVEKDFLDKYNVLGSFSFVTPKSEKVFIYSYEVAEILEKMYPKWEKSKPILEVMGEVKLEAYTPTNSPTTMITKYIITGIREISKDAFKKENLEKGFKLTVPAVIKKSEIEKLTYHETPEEVSVRVPVYTPIYIRQTKEYVYYPQEVILSSKYIFGKSFKNVPDLTAPKSIMDMLKDNMLEGSTEYRAIRYEATALNKYEQKKSEFTPNDLNEKEKFIYDNYLKEGEERKKFLEYKCKETQFVNSVVKKNFIELLLMSNEVSGYTEPLTSSNVCILDAQQIDTLIRTGLKPATLPTSSSKEEDFFPEPEEPETKENVVEEKPEPVEDNKEEAPQKTAEELEKEIENSTIDDDDFPF